MKLIQTLLVLYLIMVADAWAGTSTIDGMPIDWDESDRLYMIACVMSEINDFALDSANVYEKSVAMSYVILRRARLGGFSGGHGIKENVLARNQFYGMVIKQENHDCDLAGRHWPHAVLGRLDEGYYNDVLLPQFERYPDSRFLASVRYLIPVEQLGRWDDQPMDNRRRERLKLFQRAINAITKGVDDVLNNAAEDQTRGAVYFGFIIDLYASKYHQPEQMVAAFGRLGKYPDMEAVRKDTSLQDRKNRVLVYNRGVDAIFFYTMTESDTEKRTLPGR